MKYLPLLAFGLLATPAFADDVNVKSALIPNEVTSTSKVVVACPEARNPLFETYEFQPCRSVGVVTQNRRTPLVLADNITVAPQPLPNATATITSVSLSCEIQADASLNDCQVVDGAKVSKKDEADAISQVNGKGHVAGAFVAGKRTRVTVKVRDGGGIALLPIG